MSGKSPILLLLTVFLANCAPAGKSADNRNMGTTGYTSPEGFEYISNGDQRVDEALAEQPVTTPTPTVTPTKKGLAPAAKPLRERLNKFVLSRFHAREIVPKRFGSESFTLKVIFNDGRPSLIFKSKFTGSKSKLFIDASIEGYTLSGDLVDDDYQTEGELLLTEKATQDTARIFYWAYQGKSKVLPNRTDKIDPNSELSHRINNLTTKSFPWVNNWSVLKGPVYYLTDFVVEKSPNDPRPKESLLTLDGASGRTGEKMYSVNVEGQAEKALLAGNAEESAGRMFEVSMQDPQTKKMHQFMLVVQPDDHVKAPQTKAQKIQQPQQQQQDQKDPVVAPIPDEKVVEEPEAEEDVPAVVPPVIQPKPEEVFAVPERVPVPVKKPSLDNELAPAKVTPEQKPTELQKPVVQEEAAPRNGRSFLRVSTSLERTNQMTRDFNRNRNIKGVKTWIKEYTKVDSKGRFFGLSKDLQTFYNYANPFRRIMEKVGQAFDVSPVYAYLTVIESAYFTGGRYAIEDTNGASSALGPFQLLSGTASNKYVKMAVGGGARDERRFFVPSSCGAARYMGFLVDIFKGADSTFAILGYFQGEGGAAKQIYCLKSADRAGCLKRAKSNGYYLKLMKSYDLNYSEMDQFALVPEDMRDYVRKKLAVYFISNDLAKYGFSTAHAETDLPDNGTVIPRRAMNDSACTAAVKDLNLKYK